MPSRPRDTVITARCDSRRRLEVLSRATTARENWATAGLACPPLEYSAKKYDTSRARPSAPEVALYPRRHRARAVSVNDMLDEWVAKRSPTFGLPPVSTDEARVKWMTSRLEAAPVSTLDAANMLPFHGPTGFQVRAGHCTVAAPRATCV